MIGRGAALLAGIMLAASPVAARDLIGVYGAWGAFIDASGSDLLGSDTAGSDTGAGGSRCLAIATPERWVRRRGAARPWLAVASWPQRGRRAEVHVALAAPRRPGAPLTLSAGGRRFLLAGDGARGWAADAAMDRAIIAAIRAARALSIESVGRDGRPIVEAYDLAGAPSAIDAAAIACASVRP